MSGENSKVNILQLILVPSIITLAITILRLVGELQHWAPRFFDRTAGGGGAIVGISWLPFLFGGYFAWKLHSAGEYPPSTARPIDFALIGIALMMLPVPVIIVSKAAAGSPVALIAIVIGALLALLVLPRGWPSLYKVLLAYGYAARIPVAIVMLFAIKGDWKTHYDVAPRDDFPAMPWVMKWFWIGALPQLVLWIAFTVTMGMLVGGLVVAGRSRKTEPATA